MGVCYTVGNVLYESVTANVIVLTISAAPVLNFGCAKTLQYLCGRCKKREALKKRRLRESDESDQCLASSYTIRDMIEQSSGSGSGLPLLVCMHFTVV